MGVVKKFVIIGPESTGKSVLCGQLAEHYKTQWLPEYAREYLLKNGTDYSYEDLLIIAKGQIGLEEKFIQKVKSETGNSMLFIDTDMYVMKVWSEYVFNKCHNWILNRIAERCYDGYILCSPDIDWVADELREYPDLATRQKLYYYYKDIMVSQAIPWVNITGNYNERFGRAAKFVDDIS
ncbi:MAG: ATP-binding protein [Ginsengibacter sp.]